MLQATLPAPEPAVSTLPALLDRAARQFGDADFLLRPTDAGWTGYSFSEAAEAAHAFALELARAGVRPGARVGLIAENRPEWGLSYLAAVGAGATVVPLDPQLTAQEVAEILGASEARHVVVSARTRPVVAEARAERLSELALVDLDDALAGAPSWPAAMRSKSPGSGWPAGSDNDVAALIFTSGTTGRPKGVMLTHDNLLTNVEGVAQTFEFGPTDRFLSVLPLHHTFECTGGFLCPLRVGASIAYARGLKSSELRQDFATSEATILLGVPLLYEKLIAAIHRGVDEAPPARRALVRSLLTVVRVMRRLTGIRLGAPLLEALRERAGLGTLRLLVSGAAPLQEEVFWHYVDLGIPILEGYGLTECSPVVAANHPTRPDPGAVGWPLPGIEVAIDDPDDEGNGEILVRGPNVMRGYYRDEAATAEVMRDGWFHTGDLGRVLGDGRLRITGRLKNMIATAAGKKIYPEEVEMVLGQSPYVTEVVVVGGRDPRGEREEVHAHVFPDRRRLEELAQAQGTAFDDAFVERVVRQDVEHRSQALAPYKRVRRVTVRRDEFPKTATGKIRRQGLGGMDPEAALPGESVA